MHQRKTSGHFSLLILLLIMVNSRGLGAQSGTSSAISGTITDASGAALPHAKVSAIEVDTQAIRRVESDANGRFLFSQVNPGRYTVTVWAEGFRPQTSQPIAVEVGRTTALNFTLTVSAATQTIEVTAQQTLLTLENPNTTTTIESKTISNLPTPARTSPSSPSLLPAR